MSAPTIVGEREFIARVCKAIVGAGLRGAVPFVLTYRPCDGGSVATLNCDGAVHSSRIPVHIPASRVEVDQDRALEILGGFLDCRMAELRGRRDAGHPLSPAERRILPFWAAVRGDIAPLSDQLAARLTGDAPDLVESPGEPDRLVWEGITRIMPPTDDTTAAAEAAQALVTIGGDDLVGLAAGVLQHAFERAVETPESRVWVALLGGSEGHGAESN